MTLSLIDQRRAREAVAEHRVGHLHFPQRQAVPRVERDQRGVERADEQAMTEDGDAAVERIDLVRVACSFCFRVYRQICRPVRASSATTTPGCVVYMTPSTTSGVASRTASPGIGNVHAA